MPVFISLWHDLCEFRGIFKKRANVKNHDFFSAQTCHLILKLEFVAIQLEFTQTDQHVALSVVEGIHARLFCEKTGILHLLLFVPPVKRMQLLRVPSRVYVKCTVHA
jgi:hypothetical protein